MRFKTTKATVVQEAVTTRTTCDICGGKANASYLYDADEITIEAKLGELYPEGDHREVHEVDICPKCFVEKVKPAIEAIGCKFRVHRIWVDDRVEEPAQEVSEQR